MQTKERMIELLRKAVSEIADAKCDLDDAGTLPSEVAERESKDAYDHLEYAIDSVRSAILALERA